MLTLTVFGASGKTGRRLVHTALAHGHTVRAFVRTPASFEARPGVTVVPGDVLDLDAVSRVLEGADGAVSALGGGATSDPGNVRSQGIANIVATMARLGLTRLVALGGGGVLNATNRSGLRSEQPTYPEVFRRVTAEHRRAWETMRDSTLDWTYACPPDIPDREATGAYRVLANVMPDAPKALANGDLAEFMVREWTLREYSRSRVGICG